MINEIVLARKWSKIVFPIILFGSVAVFYLMIFRDSSLHHLLANTNYSRQKNELFRKKTSMRFDKTLQRLVNISVENEYMILKSGFDEINQAQIYSFGVAVQHWQQSCNRPIRIAVIGGSVTRGHGAGTQKDYASVFERILNTFGVEAEVHNAAMSGTGSVFFTDSLTAHFNMSSYDFLVAEFSINDYNRSAVDLGEVLRQSRRLNPRIHIIYLRLNYPLRIFGLGSNSTDAWKALDSPPQPQTEQLSYERQHAADVNASFLWLERYFFEAFNISSLSFVERRNIAMRMAPSRLFSPHPGPEFHVHVAWCLVAYFKYCFRKYNQTELSVGENEPKPVAVAAFESFWTIKRYFHEYDELASALVAIGGGRRKEAFVASTTPGLFIVATDVAGFWLDSPGAFVNFKFTKFSNQPEHCQWWPRLNFLYKTCLRKDCSPGIMDIELQFRIAESIHLDWNTSLPNLSLPRVEARRGPYKHFLGDESLTLKFCTSKPFRKWKFIELELSFKLLSTNHSFFLNGVNVDYICCN